MRNSWARRAELASTGVLATCALVVTLLVVRRELGSREQPQPSIVEVRDWKSFQTGRVVFGAPAPVVRAVVFSDFQCPFCKTLAVRLDSLLAKYPNELSVEFRHFPLRAIHPWAEDAARAAECANSAGVFKPLHDSLFANGSRLYPEMIANLAMQAGISDTASFQACLSSLPVSDAIRNDSVAATALNVAGTPTTLFNHLRVVGAPTVSELDSIIASLLIAK